MKFSEVDNNIGRKVHLNGDCDLAMDSRFRPFLYPKPETPEVFTIIKRTRGGLIYIQCDSNGKYFSVPCGNIDLIQE